VIYNSILDNCRELVIKGENGVGFWGSGIAGSNIHKELKNKNQLNATYYFIVLLIGSTYFGHCYAHHQELATIMLVISFWTEACRPLINIIVLMMGIAVLETC